jgi:ubiquitin-conjugating enzyme E2 W
MATFAARAKKRLDKELERFYDGNDTQFVVNVKAEDTWIVAFTPTSGPFCGESYNVYFHFTKEYPMSSPEVKFMLPAPEHPHVYSNGHICLNILYDDWSPALTARSVCVSLMSMLVSCPEKGVPPDNRIYCARTSHEANPKNTRFMYDDETV